MTQDSAFDGADIDKYLQLYVLQIPGVLKKFLLQKPTGKECLG
jgi:hypothetical protein